MPNKPPLFPPGHERITPIPDVLLPYAHASHAEQMRRVRAVLEGALKMYRRRFASLSGTLGFVSRGAARSSDATEAARRILRAIAGTTELRAWECSADRVAVAKALETALAHCSPEKRRWLEVAR